MLNFIIAPTIVATICFFIYRVFELYARRRERMLIIERINNFSMQGNLNIPDPKLLIPTSCNQFTALRIGLMLFSIGIGLVVAFCFTEMFFELEQSNRAIRDKIDLMYFAFSFTFAGLGLLSAFVIERKMTKKDNRNRLKEDTTL